MESGSILLKIKVSAKRVEPRLTCLKLRKTIKLSQTNIRKTINSPVFMKGEFKSVN